MSTFFLEGMLPFIMGKAQRLKFKVKVKVQSSKFKAQSSKLKVQSSKLKAQSSKFKVQSSKFKAQRLKFKAQSSKCKWSVSDIPSECNEAGRWRPDKRSEGGMECKRPPAP
jgi:hypothetical protein